MSVIDIIFRVDEICKKYDKYDIEKQRQLNAYGDDAFARLYATVEAEIEAAMEVKGLSKEEQAIRADLVLALPERIQAIPDGSTTGENQTGGWTSSTSHKNITFDTSENLSGAFFQQSEESEQFRQEYDRRKQKQDEGLDVISEGLDTLKNLAQDMGEELDRQVPLMDEIDSKVDKANSDLRNTNVKLKQTITKMRSSRNFCIDIILICVILGIASYIYNILQN
ncbi:SYP71 [Linum perenne]